MFRWRSDKHRITAVFRFQFHATQVLEFGGNGLVLSLVPAENGKPTAKLDKSVLRENDCYWENSVYETVKLIQDIKTGKIQERTYYFLISTGSPKGSLVGEFSVNISDYVAATKACLISFPFKKYPHSHLHVSIQRIQENSNQRELEENVLLKMQPEEQSLRRHFDDDTEEGIKANSAENEPLRKTVSPLPGVNGMRRGSNGSDITLSSSDSSSGLDTPRELGIRNQNTSSFQISNGSNYQDQQTRWDLAIVPVNGSGADYAMSSPSYSFSNERFEIGLDDSVEKLKANLVVLSRRAELSDLELQTLRKQIVKESKKGQDLLREINGLKEERDALKDECEKLKASQKRSEDFLVKNKLQFEGDPWTLVDEIREELNHEKELNINLRLQLQKTQESNAELLLAVQDLDEMFEKSNREISVSYQPNRSTSCESAVEIEESIPKCQSDDDEEQKALEELVKQHSDAQESYLLEQKVMDLCSEIEMYRRDKDELEMQLEQLALDYEILKQENHEFSCKLGQSYLQDQLKVQSECSSSHTTVNELQAQKEKLQNDLEEHLEELSKCLATIRELEACNKNLEEDIWKRNQGFNADKEALTLARLDQEHRAAQAEAALAQSKATITELETEIHMLRNELKEQLKQLSSSLAAIKELETHNCDLGEELEKQAQGFEIEVKAQSHAKIEQEQRALQAEKAVSCSNATISELEGHIKRLESELKRQSEESFHTTGTIKELEAHIQDLEEELEKQAEGFEADLGDVINAKVEQEKRAIQAEEALRLMKWKNASTAARIQDEFKRLSTQMQSSFSTSEKLSSKALAEGRELRLQNHHLRDMLQKANEDFQSAKDDYETKLQELYVQINVKSTQIVQIAVESKEDPKQLNKQLQHAYELQQSTSADNLDLRAEIERLTSENKSLAEQVEQGEKLKSELEQMKPLIKEQDLGNEKEHEVMTLKSELDTLRAQCDNLKHSLYEDELEKEKLRMQVFQLKADLKKKDEAISINEKKSKENGCVVVHERSKATSKNMKSESLQVGSKEVITLKEKIKLLEGQIKAKEAATDISTIAFLAKEKDLYGKIEELQARLGEIGQHCPEFGQHIIKEEKVSVGTQVDSDADEVTLDMDDEPEKASIPIGHLKNMDLTDSDGNSLSSSQSNPSGDNLVGQQRFDILLKEMVLLKEKNNSMETELKEIQDRYSEISLRFAEVEGERQRLVMKLRNIKNAKKA